MAGNQRPAILIVTHADFGEALLRAAEVIIGRQEGVATLSLAEGESLEGFRDKVGEAIGALDRESGVLVMLDLFGGTPANAAALNLLQPGVECVAGVNLPMLLEVLMKRDRLRVDELATLAVEAGAAGVADVRKALEARTKGG